MDLINSNRNPQNQTAVQEIKPGMEVKATLLEAKTKKGKWKAKLEDGKDGTIMNSDKLPSTVTPGDTIRVVVKSAENYEWVEDKRN